MSRYKYVVTYQYRPVDSIGCFQHDEAVVVSDHPRLEWREVLDVFDNYLFYYTRTPGVMPMEHVLPVRVNGTETAGILEAQEEFYFDGQADD